METADKFRDNELKKKTLLKIDEFFWIYWVTIMPKFKM